jgi:hypothetical protein
VRAQDHRYSLSAVRCSKSSSQGNLREATYDECDRLESCSKDPIGYADGNSLYESMGANPSTLNDPSGLKKCSIKKHDIVETNSCELFVDAAGKNKFGSQFLQKFEFGGDCECCLYSQYVLDWQTDVWFVVGGLKVRSVWSPGVKNVGEGVRDCFKDKNGKEVCLGDPNNGYPGDQYVGCTYQMVDAPGVDMDELSKELKDLGLLAKNTKIRIRTHIRLLFVVRDICCKNNIIHSETWEHTCGPIDLDPI